MKHYNTSTTQRRAGKTCLVTCTLVAALAAAPAQAVNWFKLRGTEPGGTARTAQLWGFIQPTYVNDFSDTISTPPGPGAINGDRPVPGTIEPDRNSTSSFFLRRARIGVRGTMTPIDNDINYFILTEWGQNGVTRGGGAAQLLDASVSFNQLSRGVDADDLANLGMRVRVGQFLFSQTSQELSRSTPGNRVHIFFTGATDAFALNRRVFDNGPNNFPGSTKVNAARDIGIELFDWAEFKDPIFGGGPLEFTYSAALGNGDTIGELDKDGNQRQYYWLSLAKLLDETRGARRHELMAYGWYQRGRVRFNDDVNNDGISDNSQLGAGGFTGQLKSDIDSGLVTRDPSRLFTNGNERDYLQEYYGTGVWYFDKPFAQLGQIRFEAEFQRQNGFILDGALFPTDGINNQIGGIRYDTRGHSQGWSIDTGHDVNGYLNKLFGTSLGRTTMNVRFDRLDRNDGSDTRGVRFDTWTLSGEYFFHPKARVTVSYQARDFETHNRTGVPKTVGDNILNEVGDRIGIQTTLIFN